MRKIISLFFLLLGQSSCYSLVEREYMHASYCHKHHPFMELGEDLLSLIPSSDSHQCFRISCSLCESSWVEEVERKTKEDSVKNVNFTCFCDCKEVRRKEHKYNKATKYSDFQWMPTWTWCNEQGIYPGYFDCNLQRYCAFFEKYLHYVKNHPDCSCFWPEKSFYAKKANAYACSVFFEIFQNTCLKDLAQNPEKQQQAGLLSNECLTTYGLVLQCTVHSFFYSDYVHICDDLYQYSLNHYEKQDCFELRTKLNEGLEIIKPFFLKMYVECLEKHYSSEIEQENSD